MVSEQPGETAKHLIETRKLRRVKKAVLGLLTIFLLSFFLIEGQMLYTAKMEEPAQGDYLVILGARVRGEQLSLTLWNRLQKGLEYIREHPDIPIILSGGKGEGEDISEAAAMKRYLLAQGIAEERLILEENSTSTYENLKYTRDIIRSRDAGENIRLVIVTSDFHLFRAKFLAQRLGFSAAGLPAETPPSTLPISLVREYFAVIKSLLFDWEKTS